MKKTFISLFLLSLLTVFGSLSVKADDLYVRNFGYQDNQWTQSSSVGQTSCAGNISPADKIITGSDFYFSGRHDDAFKRSDNEWTGVNGANNNHAGVKACTRASKTVSLSAGTYTFKLLSKNTENATLTLPKIILGSDEYTVTDIIVDESSQSFSSNQYYYTGGKETTLCYGITLSSAYNGTVSVEFKDGWKEKYLFKTLTISSSAPAAPTYEVSATASNGTVSGTGSFEEGASVTLTASPDQDYSFSGWLSVSGVDLTGHLNANPLIFTMPGNAVSLTANFTACTKHTVTLADDGNGSTSGGGLQCDGSVTVTATPNTGYRFVNWTNTSTSAVVSTDAEYTFTLSADISLTANFEVNPCTNTKTIQCEDETIYRINSSLLTKGTPTPTYGTSHSHYSGADGDYVDFKGTAGEHYYMVHLPAATYSFTVYKAHAGNSWLNIWEAGLGDALTYNGVNYGKHHGDGYNIIGDDAGDQNTPIHNSTVSDITLTEGDYIIGLYGNEWAAFDKIVITATSNVFCNYTITMADGVNGGNPTSDVASAAEGATVTVTAGEPASGYFFSGWTALPSVTFSDASISPATFTMPASNVTITANYTALVLNTFTYTKSGEGTISCETESGSSVVSGTTIEMTAVPSGDYVFTGWTATAGSFSNPYALTTNFTMPASAATVTANFAQVDNLIITGDVTSTEGFNGDGSGTMNITSVADFDAFNHEVLKFAYSNMEGNYKGRKILINTGYNSASSAQATGFGFYYKTEKADDNVAFCFEVSSGQQVKWQLAATNNEWKYFYFPHAGAASWNGEHIAIFMNGDDTGNYSTWNGQGTHTTYKDGGAFYMSEIAATSITSKSDIANYRYTNDRGGAMQVDDYGTLCLPMAGTISGATLYSVAGKETGDINYLVLEDKGTSVEAGKPYITQSTATSYTVTMSGAHSAVQDGNGLVGTYETIDLTPYAEPGTLNYFLYANAFKKAGTGVTVGAYRAYLNWGAVSAAPAQAPSARRIRMVIEGTEVQTGMETVTAMPKTTKVLIDGQLFIIREGKRYTLTGARAQ